MEHLKPQNEEELEEAVKAASRVIAAGGLIIYPTDTIYGIGVDATNKDAISKVYSLKGRDEKKPLPVIVSDLKMAEGYVELNELAEKIASRVLPGPLTLLLKNKKKLPENLTMDSDTLGIRIPDSFFCIALAKTLGKPYTTTSANKAGEPAGSIDEILYQLEEHKDFIDLVIDVGALDQKPPSTILDVSKNSVVIVREGEQNLQALKLVTLKDVD